MGQNDKTRLPLSVCPSPCTGAGATENAENENVAQSKNAGMEKARHGKCEKRKICEAESAETQAVTLAYCVRVFFQDFEHGRYRTNPRGPS